MKEKLLVVATEVAETVTETTDPTKAEEIVNWFNEPNTQAVLIVGGLILVSCVVLGYVYKKFIKPRLR